MGDRAEALKYSAQVSKTIGTVHLMLAVLALTIYLSAVLTSVTLPLFSLGSFFTVCFFISAFVQRNMCVTRRVPVWAFACADILLFTLIIWSFVPLYGGMMAAALKSPTYTFIFALLTLQALRGDARLILFLGGTAIGARLVFFLAAVSDGVVTTTSYTWYQQSPALMYTGEGELILALLMFTAFLAALIRQLTRKGGDIQQRKEAAPAQLPGLESEEPERGMDDPEKELIETLEADPDLVSKDEQVAETLSGSENSIQDDNTEKSDERQLPIRVLLAEDSQVNMMVIEKMLPPPDFQLAMAEDGQEALDLFKRLHEEDELPDVILLDIEMPFMSGYEVAEKIRAYEKQQSMARLPIIAVTALGGDSHMEASLESGMDDHLVKPVKKEDLLTAITKSLALSARD